MICCETMKLFRMVGGCTPRLNKEGFIAACDDEFSPNSWKYAVGEENDEGVSTKNVGPIKFCPWCGERVK